jgi:hypothetical protein
MQLAIAEFSRTKSISDESGCESDPVAQASSDRISSRGLEILRILNDVFNGLPSETSVGTHDWSASRE